MTAAPTDSPKTDAVVSIERAAGLGVVVSLANIGAAVIRSKAAAIFLGPSGVGIVAEIQQLATLALVPLAAFAGPALAQAFANRNGLPAARVAGAALTWTALSGLALTLIFGLAAPVFLPRDWSVDARPLVLISGLAMMLTAVANVALQTLVFRGRLRSTTQLQLLSVVVTTIAAVLCTWQFGVVGQFVAMTVAAAVVLPYDSTDQTTSGVLVDAIASGRPVVATAFPHATELLSTGAGIVVGHDDPEALRSALHAVLTQPRLAGSMAAEARRLAPSMTWPIIARSYQAVAQHILSRRPERMWLG